MNCARCRKTIVNQHFRIDLDRFHIICAASLSPSLNEIVMFLVRRDGRLD